MLGFWIGICVGILDWDMCRDSGLGSVLGFRIGICVGIRDGDLCWDPGLGCTCKLTRFWELQGYVLGFCT